MRVVAFMLALAAAGAAAAGEPPPADEGRARELYRDAQKLYDVGEYSEAEMAFKKAYLLFDHPAFLLNMAQCERQMRRNTEALTLYRAYLRRAPAAVNRAEVEALIARLEGEGPREGLRPA